MDEREPTIAPGPGDAEVLNERTEIYEATDPQETSLSLAAEVIRSQHAAEELFAAAGNEFSTDTAALTEMGEQLGLTREEVNEVLEEERVTEKSEQLKTRLNNEHKTYLATLLESARIAASAIALGIAVPAFAEIPADILHEVEEAQMGQAHERKALPSYEQVKRQLVDNILTSPVEERAFFVHRGDAPPQTILFKRGESVSVGLDESEFEQLKAAVASRVVDIEGVHTHPLSAVERTGSISGKEADRVRSGERPRFSFAPSSIDWMSIVGDDLSYGYPSAQWSERVIDPAGEWEYGLSDSGSAFVRGLRGIIKEMGNIKNAPLTEEERTYLSRLLDEKKETFFVMEELSRSPNPLAGRIMNTLHSYIGGIFSKHVSLEEMKKFSELSAPFSPDMTVVERAARISRMQALAQELGFRVRYTPNSEVPQQ